MQKEPGFYWVDASPSRSPVVAELDERGFWWFVGSDLCLRGEHVRVVSERLVYPADLSKKVVNKCSS